MFRFTIVLLIALGLVSCGPQGGASIEGKWAWFDASNCEGDVDTIEFAGRDFFHRQAGEILVQGQDVAYQQTTENGSPRVTAIYGVNGRTISLTFEPQGGGILIFRGSTIDGVAPDGAARAMGRELYRCE